MLVTGGVNFEKQTTTPNWYNRRPRILYKQTVLKSVELLNMDGTWNCPMPQLPVARFGHSQAGAVTCAGRDGSYEDTVQKSCVTLSSDWEQTHTMAQKRRYHSAWRSPRGIVLMGGGLCSLYPRCRNGPNIFEHLTTTEILTQDGGTSPGFTLRYEIT